MKPKKIRVINSMLCSGRLEKGKIYDVEEWDADGDPIIIDEEGVSEPLVREEWKPVSEFNYGDPVWAWYIFNETNKIPAIYVDVNPVTKEHLVCYLISGTPANIEFVEHRKPTMTLKELADKADVNLDEVEIVD